MEPVIEVLLAAGAGGVASQVVEQVYVEFVRNRVWGKRQRKHILVTELHDLIGEKCDESLLILAGNPHWLPDFTQLVVLKRRADIKILYDKAAQSKEECKTAIQIVGEEWGIPIRPLPYDHPPLKGYIVDGRVFCTYEGHQLAEKRRVGPFGKIIENPVFLPVVHSLFLDTFFSIEKMEQLEGRIEELEKRVGLVQYST